MSNKYERLSTNRDDSEFQNEEINLDNAIPADKIIQKPNTMSSKLVNIAVGTVAIIMLHLSLSICLTFYQRWLLMKHKFPLSIVLYHLIFKLVMSSLMRGVYSLVTRKSRVQLDFRTSLYKMAPTGIASGIDIGFSNWGLEIVQISLYTMTKSSTIIFILFFAILLGLEKKSLSLVAIVGMIASGLFLFTYKSTQFDAMGFTFLLFASFTSGIRWCFAQIIMQKSKLGLHNPIDMIFHMQPWMILSILPFTIVFEGDKLLEKFGQMQDIQYDDVFIFCMKLSTGALLAFLMEVSEFLVLSYTSCLTLSIAGIFKDIFQLALAVQIYGDQLSFINIIGLAMCIGGICCHIIHKYSSMVSLKTESLFESNENSSTNDNSMHSVSFHKNSLQNVPLLDTTTLINSESEDISDENEQNASEVIFDVLKRRDIR